MFKPSMCIVAAALAMSGVSADEPSPIASAQNEETIDVVKLSEAFGHLIASRLEAPGFTFDLEGIIRGMKLAQAGKPSPMSTEEYDRTLTLIQRRAFEALATRNLDAANSFMAQNRSRDGVIELEAGKLQILKGQAGKGAEVVENGTPVIHYTGRFIDGTQFGTSRESDPIPLPLAQTIPGFRRGIAGMKEGEHRTLFVHPDLGYGVSGQLPPNSLLVFEVEVVKAEANSSAQK